MRKVMPAALCVAFILAALWFLINGAYSTARGGAQLPPGSARRFDPYGPAALYRTLLRVHHPVHLLTHPILTAADKGVLLVVVPPGGARAATENYSVSSGYNPPLLKWIRAGNTFLEFSQNQTRIMSHFDVTGQRLIPRRRIRIFKTGHAKENTHGSQTKKHKKQDQNKKPHDQWNFAKAMRVAPGLIKSSRGPWYSILSAGKDPDRLKPWLTRCVWTASEKLPTPGLPAGPGRQLYNAAGSLELLGPQPFIVGRSKKSGPTVWHILARLHSKPVAIERQFGSGHVIFVASPWPVYNTGVAQADNLNFILALVGKKPVIFDEWQLGLGQSESVIRLLASNGLLPFLLQLIMLLLLYAWSRGGYPIQRSKPAAQRTDTVSDQIMSLGYLYARALSDQEIGQRIHREMVDRLSAAIGCRHEELPQRVKGLSSVLSVQVQYLLNQVNNGNTSMDGASGKKRKTKQSSAETRRFMDNLAQLSVLCEELKRVRYSKS